MSDAIKGDPEVDREVIEFTSNIKRFVDESDEMLTALCGNDTCMGLSLKVLRDVRCEMEHLMGFLMNPVAEVSKHVSIKHEQALGGEKSARLALEQRISELGG